jgi:hypothetical protein
MIAEAPAHPEYMGALVPAIAGGTFDSWRSIPLYSGADMTKAQAIAKKVRAVCEPPTG